jgi:L-methionine (R)-S-oxide reductase
VKTEDKKAGILDILRADCPHREKLQRVCDFLRTETEGYDWVGYYIVDANAASELILGPYSGAPTDHTRIRFGEGICGQAASTLKVFIIDDVAAESNYLSCSPDVKSEFVAPVLWKDCFVGELDLDSCRKAAFGATDIELLNWVAEVTSESVAHTAGFKFAE